MKVVANKVTVFFLILILAVALAFLIAQPGNAQADNLPYVTIDCRTLTLYAPFGIDEPVRYSNVTVHLWSHGSQKMLYVYAEPVKQDGDMAVYTAKWTMAGTFDPVHLSTVPPVWPGNAPDGDTAIAPIDQEPVTVGCAYAPFVGK